MMKPRGAADGPRTRDTRLGRPVLCQLSYCGIETPRRFAHEPPGCLRQKRRAERNDPAPDSKRRVVPMRGFEPRTHGLKIRCSSI